MRGQKSAYSENKDDKKTLRGSLARIYQKMLTDHASYVKSTFPMISYG